MRLLSFLFAVTLAAFSPNLQAQKRPVLSDDTEIVARAKEYLYQSAASGLILEKVLETGVKGEFIFDITLYKNGNVLTIYAPYEIPDEMIRPQNKLKDILMVCEFPFKLPKNKRVKFRHNFKFS
ncbi:MAG: hypothetical protein V4616_03400 [Bacteroidota bacterium]